MQIVHTVPSVPIPQKRPRFSFIPLAAKKAPLKIANVTPPLDSRPSKLHTPSGVLQHIFIGDLIIGQCGLVQSRIESWTIVYPSLDLMHEMSWYLAPPPSHLDHYSRILLRKNLVAEMVGTLGSDLCGKNPIRRYYMGHSTAC